MTKKTRIIVLSDNRSNDCRLQTEHGLSVYMESTSGKFLLDTGASDLFVRNAEKLGIDLSDVDYCLISHGHNDHIGGLMAFLEINKKAKVILSSCIPGSVYVSVRRYQHSITGNVDFTKYKDRFIFVRENTIINDIHVYADISMRHTFPLGDKNLLIRDETGNLVKDTFRHELAFVVDGILFTGCAHNGIINILGSVDTPFHISIGGFHLLDSHIDQHYESDDQLRLIASYLAQHYSNVQFYTGHCTGDHSFSILANTNDNLHQFYCGAIIVG